MPNTILIILQDLKQCSMMEVQLYLQQPTLLQHVQPIILRCVLQMLLTRSGMLLYF